MEISTSRIHAPQRVSYRPSRREGNGQRPQPTGTAWRRRSWGCPPTAASVPGGTACAPWALRCPRSCPWLPLWEVWGPPSTHPPRPRGPWRGPSRGPGSRQRRGRLCPSGSATTPSPCRIAPARPCLRQASYRKEKLPQLQETRLHALSSLGMKTGLRMRTAQPRRRRTVQGRASALSQPIGQHRTPPKVTDEPPGQDETPCLLTRACGKRGWCFPNMWPHSRNMRATAPGIGSA